MRYNANYRNSSTGKGKGAVMGEGITGLGGVGANAHADANANADGPVSACTHSVTPDVDLRAAGEVSRGFLERMPGGLFRYRADEDEELDYINQGLVDMFGCKTSAEFRAFVGNSFKGIVHPDDSERVHNEICEQVAVDSTDVVTYRIVRKDGEVRWVEDWGRLVTDSTGESWFYVSILDITEKIRSQEELRASNERLRILTYLNNDVVFDIDCRTGAAEVYGDFEARFGRPPRREDFTASGECDGGCQHDPADMRIRCHDGLPYEGCGVDIETALPDRMGRPTWCRHQSIVLLDDKGVPYRHVGRLLDTHDMTVRALRYRERAERDSLTNVLNRKAAVKRIKRSLRGGDGASCALMFIDVDDFKLVNDRFGHPTGDQVLTCLADFLRDGAREGDVVARFGGDEFLLFVADADDVDLAVMVELLEKRAFAAIAEKVPAALCDLLTLSIGVASARRPDVDFDELYRRADAALYEAKRAGKGCSRFA